jgi:hypothetical protein
VVTARSSRSNVSALKWSSTCTAISPHQIV